MTKKFIELGGTYESKNGVKWECIFVKRDRAWLMSSENQNFPAYVFKLDGTPISYAGVEAYELLPPKPKIDKNDANLWYKTDGRWGVLSRHDEKDINGTMYTHPEAKVALFVPLNIDGETLAEAIGALQEEIGG